MSESVIALIVWREESRVVCRGMHPNIRFLADDSDVDVRPTIISDSPATLFQTHLRHHFNVYTEGKMRSLSDSHVGSSTDHAL